MVTELEAVTKRLPALESVRGEKKTTREHYDVETEKWRPQHTVMGRFDCQVAAPAD